MFGDVFKEDDQYLELILLLLQIMEIVFSSEVSRGQLVQLESLIFQHHNLYKELFPNVNMINKHHHMVHYPTCIRMFGPMSTMSCMRYEARHNFFKKHAHMICNFKNICKSMAFKNQLLHCCHVAKRRDYSDSIEVGNGMFKSVSDLPFASLLQQKDFDSYVFVANAVKFNHVSFRPRQFLCISDSGEGNNLSAFGKIIHVLVANNTLAFIVSEYVTCHFDDHYRAYAIAPASSVQWRCVMHYELHHFHPYNTKKPYNFSGNLQYIVLRHNF